MQSQKNCPIGTLYRPCERQEGTIIFMCIFYAFLPEKQEGFLFACCVYVYLCDFSLLSRCSDHVGILETECECGAVLCSDIVSMVYGCVWFVFGQRRGCQ